MRLIDISPLSPLSRTLAQKFQNLFENFQNTQKKINFITFRGAEFLIRNRSKRLVEQGSI